MIDRHYSLTGAQSVQKEGEKELNVKNKEKKKTEVGWTEWEGCNAPGMKMLWSEQEGNVNRNIKGRN